MFATKGQETKKLVFNGLVQTYCNFVSIQDDKIQGSPGDGSDGCANGTQPTNAILVDPTESNNFSC